MPIMKVILSLQPHTNAMQQVLPITQDQYENQYHNKQTTYLNVTIILVDYTIVLHRRIIVPTLTTASLVPKSIQIESTWLVKSTTVTD